MPEEGSLSELGNRLVDPVLHLIGVDDCENP
jgi:hypothetical protein